MNRAFQILSSTIATFFGVGLLPKMPGTWGTFAALPFIYFSRSFSLPLQFGAFLFCFTMGCWAAHFLCHEKKVADLQTIVIDEVIGVWIACAVVPLHWGYFLLAAVVFRFFDIAKLPPVRGLDSLSKSPKYWRRWVGTLVVADDVLAGLQSAAVLLLIQYGIEHWS